MNTTNTDYINVSLPKAMVHRIDEIVNQSDMGYTSRADFVKDAVRDKLRSLLQSLS